VFREKGQKKSVDVKSLLDARKGGCNRRNKGNHSASALGRAEGGEVSGDAPLVGKGEAFGKKKERRENAPRFGLLPKKPKYFHRAVGEKRTPAIVMNTAKRRKKTERNKK